MKNLRGSLTGKYIYKDGEVIKISDKVPGEIEKAPYWKRACNPKLDLQQAKNRGYDL